MSDLYGIWIGKDATVAIIKDFRISFLRIEKEKIASVLYHNKYGIVAVVYGLGYEFNAKADMAMKNPETGEVFSNSDSIKQILINHANDNIRYDADNDELIYSLFNGSTYTLTIADKIDMEIFNRHCEIDNTVPVAQRMAKWCINEYFECNDSCVNVGIDTVKYSIYFYLSVTGGHTYCRVGQNGFCEKGRAMLSPICIRHNECRMLEDNNLSKNDYKPILDCFVDDACAFPPDGGWYWSLKEVTDDVIYLNGCGGVTYEIHRKK